MLANLSGRREKEVSDIADAIRGHFARHPEAADTLDGIAKWWLGSHSYAVDPARLQEALNRLIAEGVVRRSRGPDGRAIYRASKTGTREDDAPG